MVMSNHGPEVNVCQSKFWEASRKPSSGLLGLLSDSFTNVSIKYGRMITSHRSPIEDLKMVYQSPQLFYKFSYVLADSSISYFLGIKRFLGILNTNIIYQSQEHSLITNNRQDLE